MSTVVGYMRAPGIGETDRAAVALTLGRVAGRSGLDLVAVYVDIPAGPGHRGRRIGLTTALVGIREHGVRGVLVLDLDHLSWHPDIRDTLIHLITDAGGTLYVADDTRHGVAAPVAFPTHRAPRAGNGHQPGDPVPGDPVPGGPGEDPVPGEGTAPFDPSPVPERQPHGHLVRAVPAGALR